MRLKEPLQGVKSIQGHMVMHFAFFFVNLLFVDKDISKEMEHNNPEQKDYFKKQQYASIAVMWAHLLMGIIQIVVWFQKSAHNHQSAQVIFWFSFLVYLIAMFYCMFIVKLSLEPYDDLKKNKEYRDKELVFEVDFWILMEVNYFWINIFSQIFFLMLAISFKYESIWKRKYEKEIEVDEDTKNQYMESQLTKREKSKTKAVFFDKF